MNETKVGAVPETRQEALEPEEIIDVGDQKIRIRVDFNAMAEIEEATGRNMMDPSAFQNPSISFLRKMFWICHRQINPAAEERTIGRLMSLGSTTTVLAGIVKAWTKSMPKPDIMAVATNTPLQ